MQSCKVSEFNDLMGTHHQEYVAINGESEQVFHFTCSRFDLKSIAGNFLSLQATIGGLKGSE